jgi:hypothetical protein
MPLRVTIAALALALTLLIGCGEQGACAAEPDSSCAPSEESVAAVDAIDQSDPLAVATTWLDLVAAEDSAACLLTGPKQEQAFTSLTGTGSCEEAIKERPIGADYVSMFGSEAKLTDALLAAKLSPKRPAPGQAVVILPAPRGSTVEVTLVQKGGNWKVDGLITTFAANGQSS